MDLGQVARLAGLPARTVRYVIDHRLLPGLRPRAEAGRRGRPRSLTALEGYLVAAAGLLLAGGARREAVGALLGRLAGAPWPFPGQAPPGPAPRQRAVAAPRTAGEALCHWSAEGPAAAELGDGANLRVRLGPVDTGWVEPRGLARLSADYRPAVVVRLDLSRLRAAFGPADAGAAAPPAGAEPPPARGRR